MKLESKNTQEELRQAKLFELKEREHVKVIMKLLADGKTLNIENCETLIPEHKRYITIPILLQLAYLNVVDYQDNITDKKMCTDYTINEDGRKWYDTFICN